MKCVRAFRGAAEGKKKKNTDGGVTILSNSTAFSAALKRQSNRYNTGIYNQLDREKETWNIIIGHNQNNLRVNVTCSPPHPFLVSHQLHVNQLKERETENKHEVEPTTNSSSSTFFEWTAKVRNAAEERRERWDGVNKKMRGTSSHHLFLCCI